jgi:hypothetical protein
MDIVVYRLLEEDIPAVKRGFGGAFRDVMARLGHETLMQASPLLQLAGDIKNALALAP